MSFIVVTHGWATFDTYKIGIWFICLHWNIPSNVKSVIDERLSSFSHFKMEKFDSTDVVFGKAVASPPQNWCNRLKGTPILSHTSLKDTVCLYELMICLMCWSLLYCLIRSRCSTSISMSLQTRSDQDRADKCLTHLRWNVAAPPWQAHAAQQAAHQARSRCCCRPARPWHARIQQQWT